MLGSFRGVATRFVTLWMDQLLCPLREAPAPASENEQVITRAPSIEQLEQQPAPTTCYGASKQGTKHGLQRSSSFSVVL